MDWQTLGAAVALLLVLEGILPFVNPAAVRTVIRAIHELSDSQLRAAGISSMLVGLLLLYLIQ